MTTLHVFRMFAATVVFAMVGALALSPARSEDPPADEPATSESASRDNIYIPREGKSAEELRAYIERMFESPVSVRQRPGFAEGIAVSAERILQSKPEGELRGFALVALMDALHQRADLESHEESDQKLAELAKTLQDDDDKRVAGTAKLYALEQRVLTSDELAEAELSALLDEVNQALEGKELDARHLRLASGTTKIINRLDDDAAAAQRMKQFGELYSASSEPELSRYGVKLLRTARKSAAKPEEPQWVGKQIEIAGTTAEGLPFDIDQYKGKVVLVDFWASWCGPCRAAMPELKQAYEKFNQDGFEIVGINLDEDLEAMAKAIDEDKLPWINLIGEKSGDEMKFPLAKKYGVRAIPTTFLVDQEGKIVAQEVRGKLAEKVETLLKGSKEDAGKDAS